MILLRRWRRRAPRRPGYYLAWRDGAPRSALVRRRDDGELAVYFLGPDLSAAVDGPYSLAPDPGPTVTTSWRPANPVPRGLRWLGPIAPPG